MSDSMDEIFRRTASRQPDQPAVLGPRADAALTYRQLDEAIETAARELSSAGVRPGSCVGLHVPSSLSYIVWNYAIWRCGGCVVPIPVELAAQEKQEICRQIALDHLLSPTKTAAFAEPFRAAWRELISGHSLSAVESPRQHPDGFRGVNAAFIRFTSGTTGDSKGVVLSHETIRERILAANDALEIGPRDRVVWVLSMSYHFTVSVVGYLSLGATIVLPANHFAAAMFDAIRRREATLLYASPMHFALLADSPEAAELPSLRLAISTTTSLEERIARAFYQRCQVPISQALGIIEVGLPCINVDGGIDRWASIGRVLPSYELRLEDVGLGPDRREILFRGPGFLDAYYEPWQTRDEILDDGWFRTGDVGRLDDEGFLFLGGRSKDVIVVGGMKFFPQEVEQVLACHPLVEAAMVFGESDPRWGQATHARVIPKNGSHGEALAQQLKQFCRQRLAAYKVPEQIEFVSSLPTTASGKRLHRAT